MIAINRMLSALLLPCMVLPPACRSANQGVGTSHQRVAAHGDELLTEAEVEAVLGGSWRRGLCYSGSAGERVKCSIYLSDATNANSTRSLNLQIRTEYDIPAARIQANVRDSFVDTVEGRAQIVEGSGYNTYYGTSIHRASNTMRRVLWVVEGYGRRCVFIEISTPRVRANAAEDTAAYDKLKALAIKVLQKDFIGC